MSNSPEIPTAPLGALEFRLLGQVDFVRCLQLQEHLIRSATDDPHPRIVVLLAEHQRMISVGRRGSRSHIRISEEQLRRKQLALRWVARGGGCVLHGPGQLAIYPIVPLQRAGWRVGDYLDRLHSGLLNALNVMRVSTTSGPTSGSGGGRELGIWGRSGRLATFGVAVRDWVSHHGVFLNVNPQMSDYRYVQVSGSHSPTASADVMGSLLSERKHAGRMTKVRSQIIASLGDAFESPHYHMHTGHPYLARLSKVPSEPARVV